MVNNYHIPVLLSEVLDNLNVQENKIYVDGTVGGGGHAYEVCKKLNNSERFVGIDQDEDAINFSSNRLAKFANVTLVRDNFSSICKILDELEIAGIDGALLDLGVSSFQLDEGKRGFSYKIDAPLDMRMDRRGKISAYDIVNFYSEDKLSKIFFEYGEEMRAKSVSRAIIKARNRKKIETTVELSDIINGVFPANTRRLFNPSRKVFQAIRIEVNNEIEILHDAIVDFVSRLNVGGRLVIISFHSLEDRIVKDTFLELASPCTCPSWFPVCTCGKKPSVKILTKHPIVASDEEILRNSRSRSAKLRCVEKIT
jgi:16S rRNA (cytosine1402-N4)-methyltransferase